mgnify:FL=1
MTSTSASETNKRNLLLAEDDVIVRFVLAAQLRRSGYAVIEAVSGEEAKAVLVAGPELGVLLSDAQLAGEHSGFALAQWVRRHRKSIEVILAASLSAKVQAVCDLCKRLGKKCDAAAITTRIQGMLAERKRRMRLPSSTAAGLTPKRKRS